MIIFILYSIFLSSCVPTAIGQTAEGWKAYVFTIKLPSSSVLSSLSVGDNEQLYWYNAPSRNFDTAAQAAAGSVLTILTNTSDPYASLVAAESEPVLLATRGELLKHPLGFDLLWKASNASVWRPHAEAGYVPLGDVLVTGYEPPDVASVWTLREDCTDIATGYNQQSPDGSCSNLVIGKAPEGPVFVAACRWAFGPSPASLGTWWLDTEGGAEGCNAALPLRCPKPQCLALPGTAHPGEVAGVEHCMHQMAYFLEECSVFLNDLFKMVKLSGGNVRKGYLGQFDVQGMMGVKRKLRNRAKTCFDVMTWVFSEKFAKRCAEYGMVQKKLAGRLSSSFMKELVLNAGQAVTGVQLFRWPLNEGFVENPPFGSGEVEEKQVSWEEQQRAKRGKPISRFSNHGGVGGDGNDDDDDDDDDEDDETAQG